MYHSTISWMMAGGSAAEDGEDRRMREHRRALQDAAAAYDRPGAFESLRHAISRFTERGRGAVPMTVTPDCCAAAA